MSTVLGTHHSSFPSCTSLCSWVDKCKTDNSLTTDRRLLAEHSIHAMYLPTVADYGAPDLAFLDSFGTKEHGYMKFMVHPMNWQLLHLVNLSWCLQLHPQAWVSLGDPRYKGNIGKTWKSCNLCRTFLPSRSVVGPMKGGNNVRADAAVFTSSAILFCSSRIFHWLFIVQGSFSSMSWMRTFYPKIRLAKGLAYQLVIVLRQFILECLPFLHVFPLSKVKHLLIAPLALNEDNTNLSIIQWQNVKWQYMQGPFSFPHIYDWLSFNRKHFFSFNVQL